MPSIAYQIVVATEHLPLLKEALTIAGLEPAGTPEKNERLGLTLVDLGVDTARLQEAADTLWALVPANQRTVLRGAYEEGLDPLLASLRDRFRLLYSGWTPTMGKNRLLHGIELLPYASVVGFDLPTPVERPEGVSPRRPGVPKKHDPRLRRVRVGIIDVRLAPHSRLEGGYLADPDGLDLPPQDGAVRQGWQGHATFIANMILEAAPSAGLVVRTALEGMPNAADPDDRFHMPLWRFAERLVEFENAGVPVLNCSLGCETFDSQPPLVLDRAIARLSTSMVIVAGAGNHGDPHLTAAQREDALVPSSPSAAVFPAALDGVLAVGALDENGRIASFNPRDASGEGWAPWIDGFFRGTDITSAYLGDGKDEVVELPDPKGRRPQRVTFGGWAQWTGTSFAAAGTTGRIAALIAEGKSPREALEGVRNDPDFTRRSPS
jgi:membrane-anchored mycosin MYCP